MNQSIQTVIKCKLGKSLKPDFSGVNIGKYSFSPLPSEISEGFETELLLNFEDKWKEGQEGSNPEREGEIILSWLSMVLRQKLKVCSSRLNNVQIPTNNKEIILFESLINFPDNISELYIKLKSLPIDLLDKYVRACECYQEALLVSNNNPTISFFLFVVSVECLSNKDNDFYGYLTKELSKEKEISKEEIEKVYKKFKEEYGLKTNFIEFILSNFDEWKKEFSEEDFRKLLSSIYNIRSLFTHEGENLEKYIKLIDCSLKSKSISTKIGNKDLEFPGLTYLSNVIRVVLINFLAKQEVSQQDNIPELALKDSLVNLKVADEETIKKGEFVFKSKIKHRD
jgi:hypothetical protein